ncbi:Clp protease N-terminal domain-containing protein [Kineosporia babensis]|uniref:Clp R domain-containing protein n=1 Tax=Kineosporia babensis TaxID=499548 RepID=A0A9X1NGS0_9ACTN|nr:Clp protease N-terminal domain-containing protein [Kineosporia babensis]MCD5312828.1 hypothetical protein [Kineosporia babensis]
MTTTPFPGSDGFTRVWFWAVLNTDEKDKNDVVGTQHLLRGMVHVAQIKAALEAYDLTEAVVARMVRDEVPETGLVPRILKGSVEPVNFSTAAAAALHRCQVQPALGGGEERSAVDVFLAILGDSQCRAVGILAECGVDIEELRESLREGRLPARRDPLPVDLHRTRDALLGRRSYRPQTRGVMGWLQRLALRISNEDYAAQPVFWVRLEADELARERGSRKIGSDDVLLALLTTYEVALAYPHLARSVQHKYRGGQALLAAGVDHARVRAAMASLDLGRDEVPLPTGMGDWPQDTGQVLERLAGVKGNRGARLLEALGVSQADLNVLC